MAHSECDWLFLKRASSASSTFCLPMVSRRHFANPALAIATPKTAVPALTRLGRALDNSTHQSADGDMGYIEVQVIVNDNVLCHPGP